MDRADRPARETLGERKTIPRVPTAHAAFPNGGTWVVGDAQHTPRATVAGKPVMKALADGATTAHLIQKHLSLMFTGDDTTTTDETDATVLIHRRTGAGEPAPVHPSTTGRLARALRRKAAVSAAVSGFTSAIAGHVEGLRVRLETVNPARGAESAGPHKKPRRDAEAERPIPRMVPSEG
jgi:hypothetical protein